MTTIGGTEAVILADINGRPLAGLSGAYGIASFTPAAAAYGAGDIMDASKEFALVDRNGNPIPPGSIIRILSASVKIDVTAVPSGQTSYSLQLYGQAQPSGQADNDAWTLASADLDTYRGSVSLGTPVDLGACLYVKSQALDTDVKLADGSSSIFARLVTDGAHTAAAVARQVRLYGIVL